VGAKGRLSKGRDPTRVPSLLSDVAARAAVGASKVAAPIELADKGETVTTPEPPADQPVAVPSPLADWGTRAVGFLIDYLPIIILGIVTAWSDFLRFFSGAIGILYWVYMGYLDGETGQTPGKAVQGIRLVNAQGELIGSGPGIGRKFAHIVDSIVCMLGWFLPIVDDKRQTIADKLMVTYVVTGAEQKPFSFGLWLPPQSPPAA
jgi:uncharacterized RDD family membrane protein YckC